MEKNNLIKLINMARGTDKQVILIENINFLMEERITLVGNSLRNSLGRRSKEINKSSILESIKKINIISSELGEKFYIKEDWESIEFFLKSTILEDICNEFKKQAN